MAIKYEHPIWALILNLWLPGAVFCSCGRRAIAAGVFLVAVTLSFAAEFYGDGGGAYLVLCWLLCGALGFVAFLVAAREHLAR